MAAGSSVVVIIVIIILFDGFMFSSQGSSSPQLEIIGLDSSYRSGIFSDDMSIFGRIVNSGETATNPFTLTITIWDNNGATPYTTSTSPQPSIIQPGQEAPFVKHFTSDDLGGYRGSFEYQVEFTNY